MVMDLLADMHELTLIHTDLKPENILLVSSEYMKMLEYKVSTKKIAFRLMELI